MPDTQPQATPEAPAPDAPAPEEAELPPLFSTWPRLYAAVLLHLTAWIVIFYYFTVRFDVTR